MNDYPNYTYIYQALLNGKLCRWNKPVINVYINPSWAGPHLDKEQLINRVQNCFRVWEDALDGKLRFNFLKQNSENYIANCDIYVDFQRNSFSGTIGQCQFTKVLTTGEYKKMYITLGLIWTQYFDQNTIHEIGHAIGIGGHSPHNLDLMHAELNPTLCGKLSIKDINTIKLVYELPLGCDYEYIEKNIEAILSGRYKNEEGTQQVECFENHQIINSDNYRNIDDETYKIAIINMVKISQNDVSLNCNIKDYFNKEQLSLAYLKNSDNK